MGNAAAKQVENAELVEKSSLLTSSDSSLSICPSLVTTAKVSAKNTWGGSKWVDAVSGDVFYASKAKGMIKSHAIISDGDGKEVAIVVTYKKGMTTSTLFICRSTPSFKTQQAVTDEELTRAGIDEGTELYVFAVIDAKRSFSAGTATYSVVIGEGEGKDGDNNDAGNYELKDIYRAEKLSAMGYQAIFKEAKSGDVIAKAATNGMSMTPTVEFSVGVDILAVILTGQTLAGDGSAGALAGAGVI